MTDEQKRIEILSMGLNGLATRLERAGRLLEDDRPAAKRLMSEVSVKADQINSALDRIIASMVPSNADLVRIAEQNPPPQEWFDGDGTETGVST